MAYKVGMMPAIACLISFSSEECMSEKQPLAVIGNAVVDHYILAILIEKYVVLSYMDVNNTIINYVTSKYRFKY